MIKNVLVIAAHPDDEILGEAGTIKKLTNEGLCCRALIIAEGLTSRAAKRSDYDLDELKDVTEDEKKNLTSMCDDLQKSIDQNNVEEIKTKKAALEKAAQDLATRVYQQKQESQNNNNSSNDSNSGKSGDDVVDADYTDIN